MYIGHRQIHSQINSKGLVVLKKKMVGAVRGLDPQGRIVIPKGLREAIEVQKGDFLEVFTDGRRIVCRKHQPGCVFCGSIGGVKDMHGVQVCRKCAKEMSRLGALKVPEAT